MKNFLKKTAICILTVIFLPFYYLGVLLYYVSKIFKIISHVLMLEFHTVLSDCKDFSRHFKNLGDL